MNYSISYEKNPKEEDISILGKGIMEYAQQQKSMKPIEFFAFFIRDQNGDIVGGCSGNNIYGCLFVDTLWVTNDLRHQGYGKKLMNEAEELARKSNCRFMAVNTFDWEGLDFYKKLGFHIEFERHGFKKDSIFYFLRKNLKKPNK